MRLPLAAALVVASAYSCAQYTYVNLHPTPGTDLTAAYMNADGEQVGLFQSSATGRSHAAVWSGSAASMVDMHDPLWRDSWAYACEGGQQFGYFRDASFGDHPALWSGSAASVVDLLPLGALSGQGYGMGTGQQVGEVDSSAALWTGSAASYVNLNNSSMSLNSLAQACQNGIQVGYCLTLGFVQHATLWTGTAASQTDMHPPGFANSLMYCTDGSQHGGWGVTGGTLHALLWTGANPAAIDMNPAGYLYSRITGIGGGKQVGIGIAGDSSIHPLLWSGTAASVVDLGLYFPPGFIPVPIDIDENGNICGAVQTLDGRAEAFLLTTTTSYEVGGFGTGGPFSSGMTIAGNRSMPITFELRNQEGNIIDNEAPVMTLELVGSPDTVIPPSSYTKGPNGATFVYDPETQLYTLVMHSKNLAAGTYRITITLSTGQTLMASFTKA